MTPPDFDAGFRARFEDLLRWRRDVRHFRPDPVPRATLDRLLDLADLAPSVGLSQPWRFVIVEDPARRSAVRESFLRANEAALAGQSAGRATLYARLKLEGLDQAPCQLALFSLPDPEQGHGLGRATMALTLDYSAVMALHTLWLAARAEGIGLGWVSILEPAVVTAALDVPEGWRLIGYFCLGYPAGQDAEPELQREGWETRRPTPRLSR
ncbi:5,6-dimethylbenzimidazole synthase [Pseudoroseomonas cervicalis]|uniref:5,6-dimethylbenzimidazole synthase n=1 Tax=Teichococcus cervicalis TaxID=204525 RepID=UPI0022F18379|nr:5,6-dimethylbenzimidazole synthase [Pseudoroseomonas cervicalis]WBV42959.1 5,6-dimethylbenzimidazole synthase [Pseudoroseomonas cervicalis]